MKKLLLVTFFSLLTACAGTGMQEDAIKVNLSNLRLLDSTLLEQRYAVKLRVQNRSQKKLTINGLSFDLGLNNKDFASGVSNEQVVIEPLSDGLLSVNISSSLFGLLRQIQSMRSDKKKVFTYQLSGTLHTGSMFNPRFNESGEIDLGDLLEAKQ